MITQLYQCQCILKSFSEENDLEESADMELSVNAAGLSELKIIYSIHQTFVLFKETVLSIDVSHESAARIQVKQEGPYFDITSIHVRDKRMITLLTKHFLSHAANPLVQTIGPSSFYGTSIQQLSPPESIFRIFALQEQAFVYFDSLQSKAGAKIFSFESALTGKRRFLVTEVREFLSRYVSISYGQRHVYEIIREAYPCRLYFDVEFCRPTNPSLDGAALCRQWVGIICWRLFELYGLQVGPHNVVDLDSSTPQKFSRHLIFNLFTHDCCRRMRRVSMGDSDETRHGVHCAAMYPVPGEQETPLPRRKDRELLFRNNLEIGLFVMSTVKDCLLEPRREAEDGEAVSVAQPPAVDSEEVFVLPRVYGSCMQVRDHRRVMWAWDKEKKQRSFVVDLGVYTRNRAFRLLLSSKYGKQACLAVTRSSPPPSVNGDGSSRRRLTDELRTNYLVRVGSKTSSTSQLKHSALLAGILERSFVVPVAVVKPSTGKQRRGSDEYGLLPQLFGEEARGIGDDGKLGNSAGFEEGSSYRGTRDNDGAEWGDMGKKRKLQGEVEEMDSGNVDGAASCVWCGRMLCVPVTVTCSRCCQRNYRAIPFEVTAVPVCIDRPRSVGTGAPGPSNARRVSRSSGMSVYREKWNRSRVVLSSSSFLPGPDESFTASPFPLLDAFVVHVASLHRQAWVNLSGASDDGDSCRSSVNVRVSQWELVELPRVFNMSDDMSTCASLTHDQSDSSIFRPGVDSIQEICPTTSVPTIYPSPVPPVYTICYQISGSRYCHNIGREHKSNSIMLEVNLFRGFLQQKCWDPDCRGYRSPPIYVHSQEILPLYPAVMKAIYAMQQRVRHIECSS